MTCLSWSLKVIGTNMDQSATYDFLLVIHSNHGPILYRFQDKHCFLSSRIAVFSIPVYLHPLLKGFPLKFSNLTGEAAKYGLD